MNTEHNAVNWLRTAIKSYIEPIYTMCGYTVDIDGSLKRYDGTTLKFINHKYNGQPDMSPTITPVIPFNDENYIEIQSNKSLEVFNPFVSRNHILALLLKLRSAMVPYCISEKMQNACKNEEDFELLENYINLYNSVDENDKQIIVGFSNTEDELMAKDLYSYKADDYVEACFGLAVTIYKSIEKKYPKEYEDIPKAWKKIQALLNKYDKDRKGLRKIVKEENAQTFDVNHMELSNNEIDTTFNPRLFDYYSDFFMGVQNFPGFIPEDLISRKEDYIFQNNDEVAKNQEQYFNQIFVDEPYVETQPNNTTDKQYCMMEEPTEPIQTTPVIAQPTPAPIVKQNTGSKIKFNSNPMMQQPPMMIPNMWGMNMQRMNVMQDSYDMNSLDLTGGDIVNPFAFYQR